MASSPLKHVANQITYSYLELHKDLELDKALRQSSPDEEKIKFNTDYYLVRVPNTNHIGTVEIQYRPGVDLPMVSIVQIIALDFDNIIEAEETVLIYNDLAGFYIPIRARLLKLNMIFYGLTWFLLSKDNPKLTKVLNRHLEYSTP